MNNEEELDREDVVSEILDKLAPGHGIEFLTKVHNFLYPDNPIEYEGHGLWGRS